MDIVLELCDTYFFDRLYSTLVPASSSQAFSNGIYNATTATFSSIREGATLLPKHDWVYQPASKYISFQPTQYAYSSAWPRDHICRQAINLFTITWVFGLFIYFVCSSLSYIFVFDKATMNHPRYLKNQIRKEISLASSSMPVMSLLMCPFFLAEVRGHTKLYDTPEQAPFALYTYLQFPLFLLFTDFCIYWIHRGLHHPRIYKYLHKPHHRWIVPTPYASHAFHPLDGFSQGVPYHIFPLIFPLQKIAFIGLFAFVNIWTILIHDGEYLADSPLLNSAACHAVHHSHFNFNMGQFTTLWDRLGGTYRRPGNELFDRETKLSTAEWAKQSKEIDKMVREVEGKNEREYETKGTEDKKTL